MRRLTAVRTCLSAMPGLAQSAMCLQLLWQRRSLGSKFRRIPEARRSSDVVGEFYRCVSCNGSVKNTILSKTCSTNIKIIQPRERQRVCKQALQNKRPRGKRTGNSADHGELIMSPSEGDFDDFDDDALWNFVPRNAQHLEQNRIPLSPH
jgi:hypothetical protein